MTKETLKAITGIEGFLQLIVETEDLTPEQKKCYQRILNYVRKQMENDKDST